jgi:hypothetical protein
MDSECERTNLKKFHYLAYKTAFGSFQRAWGPGQSPVIKKNGISKKMVITMTV